MGDEIQVTFYVDYVEIDKQERTIFNVNEIDYFYDFTEKPILHTFQTTNESIPLHYTKPIKELILVFYKTGENNDMYNFEKIDNIEVRLNNIKLETTDDETYFRLLQPYYHNRKTAPNTNIYMYSFAFDPDNSQPTGAYNFGNLKTKELKLIGNDLKDKTVSIYATSNNILKVKEGQSSIQYI
jgi:hypothetical protein